MKKILAIFLAVMGPLALSLSAQNFFQRFDSVMTEKYRKGDIDTAYIMRPRTKWTVKARFNLSGATIESEGIENGQHFKSEMTADYKSTLSMDFSYLGISLNTRSMNLNAYYAFNGRRFSYPAAFSQSYIQRRSAGSFLLAASGMGQQAKLDWNQKMKLKMTNIGMGAGYGYNYVPAQGWLLHISGLPTFIVYSKTSMTFGDNRVPLHYHFPEVIITGRGAVIRQRGNKFYGLSMVYNFTNIGNEESLALHNQKWRIRAFFGFRL